jgi:hypothetical protein
MVGVYNDDYGGVIDQCHSSGMYYKSKHQTNSSSFGLELLLPAGTVTFPREGTTIDLVRGNNRAAEAITKSKVSPRHDRIPEHFAIEIILNLQTPIRNVEQS